MLHMNSNFLLSGLISLSIYTLLFFSLVFYFHVKSDPITVGQPESISVAMVTLDDPQHREQVEAQTAAVDTSEVESTPPQPEPEPSQPTSQAPRASIADAFTAVSPSASATTADEPVRYRSSYAPQEIAARDEVTIHSLKDVTIATVAGGDVTDELIMELQNFLYERWAPPRNVGEHTVVLNVNVLMDGTIVYNDRQYVNSRSFNRAVERYMQRVTHFRPIDRELKIELILKTQE